MPRNFRGGSRSRSRSWSGATGSGFALSLTQLVLATFSLSTDFDETLLRSRGEVILDGVPNAANDEETVGLGLIVVQEAAGTQGGVSVPGPINDIDADWLWHRFVPMSSSTLSAGASDAILAQRIIELDSKAMRKVARDQVIVMVGELSTGTFATMRLGFGVRMLSQITGI